MYWTSLTRGKRNCTRQPNVTQRGIHCPRASSSWEATRPPIVCQRRLVPSLWWAKHCSFDIGSPIARSPDFSWTGFTIRCPNTCVRFGMVPAVSPLGAEALPRTAVDRRLGIRRRTPWQSFARQTGPKGPVGVVGCSADFFLTELIPSRKFRTAAASAMLPFLSRSFADRYKVNTVRCTCIALTLSTPGVLRTGTLAIWPTRPRRVAVPGRWFGLASLIVLSVVYFWEADNCTLRWLISSSFSLNVVASFSRSSTTNRSCRMSPSLPTSISLMRLLILNDLSPALS